MKKNRVAITGWFAATIFALAEGNFDFFQDESWRRNGVKLEEIKKVLSTLKNAGFARNSNRGWKVMEHPALGQISWKQGIDFRSCGRYLFLRLNGQMVISVWPAREVRWDAKKASNLTERQRGDVIHALMGG